MRRQVVRDRHGRGLRGPLAPAGNPCARTRNEEFNDLVLDAVERLERRWRRELAVVEFAVEAVPPAPAIPPEGLVDAGAPLGRLQPGGAGHPARVVIYRRPVEARTRGRSERAVLVQDVVVEQVAQLLGLDPEAIDPGYHGD
ncbi:MAG: metallopeptidase family protein [Sporichthyaceae bacterium]